jgi:hypothetical protein
MSTGRRFNGRVSHRWLRTFTLVAIPGKSIPMFVAQQVATATEETASAQWACSTVSGCKSGVATDLQLEMTATSMCRTLTPGNSGKICRSLRSQQELPQQELIRVRFACFGLSVLLGTNSFSFPKPQAKAPQIHRILRHQVGQPSPKPAHNHHMLRASREEWHQWASEENANGQRLCRESQKQTN